jgi:C_GCAxxG_C_C family probable redox protein
MSEKTKRALELFGSNHNCAQSVCGAFEQEHGLPTESWFALGAPFGGGVAHQGELCGAVTGALLVLGLRHARGAGDPAARKKLAMEAGQRFVARFKGAHGSIVCRDLLGCDLGTPEGRQAAVERKLFQTTCPKFVEAAAAMVDDEGA